MRVTLLVFGFLALTATSHAEDLYPQGKPARAAPPARLAHVGRLAREAPPIPASRFGGVSEEAAPSGRTPSTRRSDYGYAGGQSVRIPIGR